MSPIHPIIWGWDIALQRSQGTNVIVTLIDDTEIYGVFGENSLASSDPNNRDLYLEKIYLDNGNSSGNDNNLRELPGVYIVANQIKMIKFL